MSTDVTLTGRLAGEPELRFSPSGVAMCKFTVVTDRRRKNNDTGEWESVDTTFWRVTAFRQLAEQIAEHDLAKGRAVIVVGKAYVNEWETRDGEKRSSLDVNADHAGPNLRWPPKTAQRTNPDQPADDPWASPPPAQSQPADDEPPF